MTNPKKLKKRHQHVFMNPSSSTEFHVHVNDYGSGTNIYTLTKLLKPFFQFVEVTCVSEVYPKKLLVCKCGVTK